MVGMGVAIIPYQAVAREVRTGQLFCARIAGQQLVRETGWVHLRLNRVPRAVQEIDRKSTRLNSSHGYISYAVFCLKKKKNTKNPLSNPQFCFAYQCSLR